MASKRNNCINPNCDSVKDLREPRMAKATRMVCDYFGVVYKQSKKVCVRCLRICLVRTKYHDGQFEADQSKNLFFNYTSHSVVQLEEEENTISTPVDISVHNKGTATDIKADNSINNIEVMAESSNYEFLNLYSPTVTQKNKSKMRVYLSKYRQNYLKKYIIHNCNHSCVEWTEYDQNKTKKMNMLAIPLHFGFKRQTKNNYGIRKSITYYITPCGISIETMQKMMHYLINTRSKMTIDQFDFHSCVNPLAQFNVSRPIKFLDDISEGQEFRPITCVNSINDELPPKMKYIVSRQAAVGVNINVERNFLCGCDCTDNCEDKSKCACWQSTINGQSNIPGLEKNPNAGYNYRRLYENVPTGIYECNNTCKCQSSCLNRVVQQPMSLNLQLFKTEKKGWGVQCLNDIARGTFVCCYIGEILTETNATEQGKKNGDEYLADLDFIEVVEKYKEGYEEHAVSSQKKSKKMSKKKMNSSNKLIKSSKGHIPTTFYDKNLALTNGFQFLESRNLKHKYLTSNEHYYGPQKSIRYYYGNGDGVYTINAKISGNIGRYFNHSCTPNLFVQNVFVDTHDLRFPWISFFSEHYIPAGTELTWNYGYEVGSIPGKVVTCYCDSAQCKRRLL